MSMYFKLDHSWFWLKVRYTFFRLKVYHKLEIWHFLFSITCFSIIKIKCCIVNQLVSYFELNSQKGTHQSVALFWIRRFLSIGSNKSVLHWSQWEGRGQHSTDQLMSSESKYPGGQCGEWPDVWCERPRPDSGLVWHCDTLTHYTDTGYWSAVRWGGDPWCSCVLWHQCSRPGQLSRLSIWSPSAEETHARASRGALYMIHVAQ